ncbi:MAG: agmatine deiminase family protein [Ignavibacterium sp.]
MNNFTTSENQESYRLPAEWEKHNSTLIAWPHNREDWPGKFAPIPFVYVEIVKKITQSLIYQNQKIIPSEEVKIIVQSKQQKYKISKLLSKAEVNFKKIRFFKYPTNRSWMRDTSPFFVKSNDNKIKAIRFKFNGWAKYDNWKKDFYIPFLISEKLNIDLIEAKYNDTEIVLEGGAIDVNGKGTLITTEECLLDQNTQVRNPNFTKKDYEKIFRKYFDISNIIWLKKGIAGDDTHGHIDDICRFVNEDTVAICKETNFKDENYKLLEENLEILKSAKLENGSKVNIVNIPMPAPLYYEKMKMPASYANFYITNNFVLVPTFNDPNDRIALGILADLFQNREVIGINSVDLVWGLGTLHCLSHEIPE